MTRSKRFEPIQEIVASSAQELSRAMGEAARRVAELERQFTQLQSYRDEYTKTSADGRGAMDAVKLQNYRSFLDRLGEALRQSSVNLDQARAEYEALFTAWKDADPQLPLLVQAKEEYARLKSH